MCLRGTVATFAGARQICNHQYTIAAALPSGFADWQITATFYAAVHYVEAVIVRNGMRSSDHRSRKVALNSIATLRPAAIDYDTLANLAWIARYRADYDFNDPALRAEVQKICGLLGSIKTAIGIAGAP